MTMTNHLAGYTFEEKSRWSLLRAIEWGALPEFLSQPVVPLFLPFFDWWKVIGIVVILSLLWSLIRYKWVNLAVAQFGVYFVFLKWIACPLAAIYLIAQRSFALAILSLLWPVLAGLVGSWGVRIGEIQKMFMAKLGYENDQSMS